jgi:hypothetical protein
MCGKCTSREFMIPTPLPPPIQYYPPSPPSSHYHSLTKTLSQLFSNSNPAILKYISTPSCIQEQIGTLPDANQRKQLNPQHLILHTGLWTPCLSAVTVPPARRPPKPLDQKRGIVISFPKVFLLVAFCLIWS